MLKLRIQTNQLFINFRVHASSLWNWNVGKYVQRQKKLRIYAPAIIARAMEFICKFRFLKFYKIRRIVAIIFFTRPSIEISSKTHLLEFPTVTHVVKKTNKMYTSQRATVWHFSCSDSRANQSASQDCRLATNQLRLRRLGPRLRAGPSN